MARCAHYRPRGKGFGKLTRHAEERSLIDCTKVLGRIGTFGQSLLVATSAVMARVTNQASQGKDHHMTVAKVLYTAKVHTTGGREGSSKSSDGHLVVKLFTPGTASDGTNPEQLFAAGWSACFLSAMKIVAGKMNIALPADAAIDAEVDLTTTGGGFLLSARLNISAPGLEHGAAEAIVTAAHQTCPYSKATRGNVNVVINLV
jgi:osmotically inducible protein OsmC